MLPKSGPPPMMTTVDAACRNGTAAISSWCELAEQTPRLSCRRPVRKARCDAMVQRSELAARPTVTDFPSRFPPPSFDNQVALSTTPNGESDRRKPSSSILITPERWRGASENPRYGRRKRSIPYLSSSTPPRCRCAKNSGSRLWEESIVLLPYQG